MAVLVDPLREYPHAGLAISHWCHMAVDGVFEELHAFAAGLGIPRARFQGDHYDLPPWVRERAVAGGALEGAGGGGGGAVRGAAGGRPPGAPRPPPPPPRRRLRERFRAARADPSL